VPGLLLGGGQRAPAADEGLQLQLRRTLLHLLRLFVSVSRCCLSFSARPPPVRGAPSSPATGFILLLHTWGKICGDVESWAGR
jgi:hypothetical protein